VHDGMRPRLGPARPTLSLRHHGPTGMVVRGFSGIGGRIRGLYRARRTSPPGLPWLARPRRAEFARGMTDRTACAGRAASFPRQGSPARSLSRSSKPPSSSESSPTSRTGGGGRGRRYTSSARCYVTACRMVERKAPALRSAAMAQKRRSSGAGPAPSPSTRLVASRGMVATASIRSRNGAGTRRPRGGQRFSAMGLALGGRARVSILLPSLSAPS